MAYTVTEAQNNKVIVRDIPHGLNRDKLFIHFQKQSNGGGDILSLVYPRSLGKEDEAVIAFADASKVSTVMDKQQSIMIGERPYQMRVLKFPPEVFETVSVYIENQCEEDLALQELLAEFNLKRNTDHGNKKVEYAGEWFEVKAFVERGQALLHENNPEVDVNHKSDAYFQNNQSEKMDTADLPDPGTHSNEEPEMMEQDSKISDNVIEIDEDIFNVTKKMKSHEVENIMNQFRVKIGEKNSGQVQLCFDEKKANYSEGIHEFQKLYEYSLERTKQINYDLPQDLKDHPIEEALCTVRLVHSEVVTSRSPHHTGRIIFLSASEKSCEDAKAQLKRFIGDKARDQPTSQRPQASSSLLHEIPFQSGLKLAVIRGNIATQSTDAIVNAANSKLQNGAGVTGAIFRAGGMKFEDECHNFMAARRDKPLKVGEVVHTKACGSLLCKNVIHVTGPVWRNINYIGRESVCRRIMGKLCHELIACANRDLQATSMSIPAISTGIYGVPLRIFCDAIIEEAKKFDQFCQNFPNETNLKRINIVNYDYREAGEIKEHFCKWGSSVDPY